MEANEFIKKFGVHIADRYVSDCAPPTDKWFIHHGALIDGEDFDDLKRLVESHELVESFKCRRYSGLSNAKDHLLTLAHIEEHEQLNRLRLAISDVESCMESSK